MCFPFFEFVNLCVVGFNFFKMRTKDHSLQGFKVPHVKSNVLIKKFKFSLIFKIKCCLWTKPFSK